MHTPLLDYGLLVQKIDKHTKKSYILNAHSVDKLYYTASTIKVVLLGLFLEYCEELLDQETNISLKDKFIGGILYETHTKKISYELLLYLMITISDNTATNIIFETLTQKLGNITIALQQKFHTLHTKFFDLRKQKNTTYIKGSGQSTAQEFGELLTYFLVISPHKDTIKKLLSYQYCIGRGLRYIEDKHIIQSGNKTGQLDDMVNDCGFIEINNDIYIFTISLGKYLNTLNMNMV